MKLIRELQESTGGYFPQLLELVQRGDFSNVVNKLESMKRPDVSMFLTVVQNRLGPEMLHAVLDHWKAVRGITERRILTNIRLSDYQKKVLASIVDAGEDRAAYENVSIGDINLIAARDTLERLGLIDVDKTQETATVTDQGMEVMKSENLIDDMGQLTDDGQQYVYYDEETQQEVEPQPEPAPGAEPEMPGMQQPGAQPGAAAQQPGAGEEAVDLDISVEGFKMLEADAGLTQEELRDMVAFAEGKLFFHEMTETAQDKLYGYFLHDMPYGVAKGRTGTADEWISEKIAQDVALSDDPSEDRARLEEYFRNLFRRH